MHGPPRRTARLLVLALTYGVAATVLALCCLAAISKNSGDAHLREAPATGNLYPLELVRMSNNVAQVHTEALGDVLGGEDDREVFEFAS